MMTCGGLRKRAARLDHEKFRRRESQSMTPKSGDRFSEKIMLQENCEEAS